VRGVKRARAPPDHSAPTLHKIHYRRLFTLQSRGRAHLADATLRLRRPLAWGPRPGPSGVTPAPGSASALTEARTRAGSSSPATNPCQAWTRSGRGPTVAVGTIHDLAGDLSALSAGRRRGMDIGSHSEVGAPSSALVSPRCRPLLWPLLSCLSARSRLRSAQGPASRWRVSPGPGAARTRRACVSRRPPPMARGSCPACRS